MAQKVAHYGKKEEASAVIRHLGRLVTHGPQNLEIIGAMSAYGYDATKWAEGQGVLAELLSCDQPLERMVDSAQDWYREAAVAARDALVTKPQLLAKLGVAESG
jgi:hypothetical protein